MAKAQLISPPPRKEDVLFRDGLPDWQNNACLNFNNSNETGYREGYRRAGRLLVEHVVEHSRDQDYLVYPIFFLYRHHIELALKNILRRTPCVIDHTLTDAEKRHLGLHRLDLLWQDLKPMFVAVSKAAGWDKLDPVDVQGIDSYIRQFTNFDRDSYSFRYTHSKKGVPSLPADLKRINLRHFAEMAERLADYLNALDTAVGVLYDYKVEMETQYKMEMEAEYARMYRDDNR
jgi:hypothetical protein